MDKKETNKVKKELQEMRNNPQLSSEEKKSLLCDYLKDFKDERFTGALLKEVFLIANPPDNDGYSPAIEVSELVKLNSGFRTTNGGDWCRDNSSPLGKEYIIKREKLNNAIYSIKLDGFNKRLTIDRGIRDDIQRSISKKKCAILDVTALTEVDHKNGMYDNWRMRDKAEQQIEDFQPLSKAANDAKREHCRRCKIDHQRYDATRLGYKVGWTKGNADSKNCNGCYWYDPIAFNEEISKDFKKDR